MSAYYALCKAFMEIKRRRWFSAQKPFSCLFGSHALNPDWWWSWPMQAAPGVDARAWHVWPRQEERIFSTAACGLVTCQQVCALALGRRKCGNAAALQWPASVGKRAMPQEQVWCLERYRRSVSFPVNHRYYDRRAERDHQISQPSVSYTAARKKPRKGRSCRAQIREIHDKADEVGAC